jgi:hypothetical protein
MKNIIFGITMLVCSSINAQTIKSLYDDSSYGENGMYYKDTHNDLDRFAGTWVYVNGTTSLTITLQKKVMEPALNGTTSFYEDRLVGEYKYIENGVTKINTLGNLLFSAASNYNIFGNSIICPIGAAGNCSQEQRRVALGFIDPNRDIDGLVVNLFVERADIGPVQKIKVNILAMDAPRIIEGESQPQYLNYTVPFGEYVMVKQ